MNTIIGVYVLTFLTCTTPTCYIENGYTITQEENVVTILPSAVTLD